MLLKNNISIFRTLTELSLDLSGNNKLENYGPYYLRELLECLTHLNLLNLDLSNSEVSLDGI